MFFIYIHDLQTQTFSNKLIASDLLMLWIIQQWPTFLTVIIIISLILTHDITKPWQPLHAKSLNLNPE